MKNLISDYNSHQQDCGVFSIIKARPGLANVIYTHTKSTSIVASLKDDLMPLNQFGLIVLGRIVYVVYDPCNNEETMREIEETLIEDFTRNPTKEFDRSRLWEAYLCRHDRVNPGYAA